jgi:hypothetical protein
VGQVAVEGCSSSCWSKCSYCYNYYNCYDCCTPVDFAPDRVVVGLNCVDLEKFHNF